MSDQFDPANIRDEYIPYTTHNPRRSTRQRSVVQHFEPVDVPRMRVEKEPTKTRAPRNRTGQRSIPRDLDHYTADEVPQAHKYSELMNNVANNAFAGGITRIPLITEVLTVSNIVIEMRYKEIHFLQEAIQLMKNKGIDDTLVKQIEKGVETLEWEMDFDNVVEDDLPPLGPQTTNYADISTWLIVYYELLHENMHRITDLNYSFTMLSKTDRKILAKHEKKAADVMRNYEDTVKSFKLEGQSKHAYTTVVNEIRKNCKVCN